MGKGQLSSGIMQEWFKSFLKNLNRLSANMKSESKISGNEMYSTIGTTSESKVLIFDLVGELDEEYALRRELEKEKNPEVWFKKKVVESVDELAQAGILEESPTQEEYDKVCNTIQEAMDENIANEAEQTAKELDSDTDDVMADEENAYYVREDMKLNDREA